MRKNIQFRVLNSIKQDEEMDTSRILKEDQKTIKIFKNQLKQLISHETDKYTIVPLSSINFR